MLRKRTRILYAIIRRLRSRSSTIRAQLDITSVKTQRDVPIGELEISLDGRRQSEFGVVQKTHFTISTLQKKNIRRPSSSFESSSKSYVIHSSDHSFPDVLDISFCPYHTPILSALRAAANTVVQSSRRKTNETNIFSLPSYSPPFCSAWLFQTHPSINFSSVLFVSLYCHSFNWFKCSSTRVTHACPLYRSGS